MKKLLMLAMIIGLTACAPFEVKKVVDIDPELAPYVETFLDEGAKLGRNIHIDNLIVRFGEQNPKYLGTCLYALTPTITINTLYWDSLPDYGKEELLMHELGHCVLGRVQHVDDVILAPDGNYIMASVMSTYYFSAWTYQHYRDYYMRELFLGIREF